MSHSQRISSGSSFSFIFIRKYHLVCRPDGLPPATIAALQCESFYRNLFHFSLSILIICIWLEKLLAREVVLLMRRFYAIAFEQFERYWQQTLTHLWTVEDVRVEENGVVCV